MLYDSNMGRYLALCRKNDITTEGAHCVAHISGYDLISPQHVALWASEHSQFIDAEMDMIPEDMSYEDTEYAMEQALAACKDDLREILWFAPVDCVQTGRGSLEQVEATSCATLQESHAERREDNQQPSGIQTPFDIPPILEMLDEIKESLSKLQEAYERIPEYRSGDNTGMTQ